ncbi:MAG: hypothetical protein ACT4PV_15670 [Planctomycetaceae bacterium]
MRTLVAILALGGLLYATETPKPVEATSEDQATKALADFEAAYKGSKEVEERQAAIFNLHAVPHDRVMAKLASLLRSRDEQIRNVAALAMGGQKHNVPKAGEILMKAFKAEFRNEIVLASVIDAMGDLNYLGYWPDLDKCLVDLRAAVAVRGLDLVAANKDWRAWETLLSLYKKQIAKGYSWETGEVTVDTGAAGTEDQEAAEAAWTAKYGEGGSKAKAAATGKAGARREVNLRAQLRRTVKALTGIAFDSGLDFEDWVLEHYGEIAAKVAVMEGKDPVAAEAKANAELPARKKQIAEEREKLEKIAEQNRKARENK